MNTNITYEDKKIASYEFRDKFTNYTCKNNNFTRKIGINLCKLYLNDKYIETDLKNEILGFMNETDKNIANI